MSQVSINSFLNEINVNTCIFIRSFLIQLTFFNEIEPNGVRAHRGRDRIVVGFTTTYYMQSVHITTDVVISNLDQGKGYNLM